MAQIIEMAVGDIVPYENNPRNNDMAVDKVAESIKEFGFQSPIIVDRNNVVIAGHTRLKAAEKLGLKKVPVIVAKNLTEEQARAYRLADNKTGELAEWEYDKLTQELNAIEGIDMTAFGFEELERALTEYNIEEDEFEPELPEEPKTKLGDIYELGDHRLMCGDSTSEDDVSRLLGGDVTDISITSPPYGAANSAKIRDHYEYGKEPESSFYETYDDDISKWADLMNDSFANMQKFSTAQFINVQLLADNKRDLIAFVNDNVSNLADVIIWDKQKAPPQMSANVLNNQFEFVFVFGEKNATRAIPFSQFHGNRNNVIAIPTGNNEYAEIHRAVFPVQFPVEIIKLASGAETVLDLFGGTGTTMIACEQLGRKCRMMELDPKYCDVIVKRWEDFTGKKAVLVNG